MNQELVDKRNDLLKQLKNRKANDKIKEEIKVLEKALKNPNIKDKGKGFLEKASKFYDKVAEYAEKIEPTQAITGNKKKEKKEKG